MALFGSNQPDEMDLIQWDAENRAKAYEGLKRSGDLPALGMMFGLNMLGNSQHMGFGQALGNAGLDALNQHRAIMKARRDAINTDLDRQTTLKRAQEDLNRQDRDYELGLQKWDYQKEQDAIKNALERQRIGMEGARIAMAREAAQRAEQEAAAQAEWDKSHMIDQNGMPRVFNAETGNWDIDESALRKDAEGNVVGYAYGGPKQAEPAKFTDVKGMRNNFREDSAGFTDLATSVEDLLIAAKQGNGVGDLGLVFGLMKALDPRSVVREGEQMQARMTGGPADFLAGYVNQLRGGGSLTEKTRDQILSYAREKLAERLPAQQKLTENYRKWAVNSGMDPEYVVHQKDYKALLDSVDYWLNRGNPVGGTITVEGGMPPAGTLLQQGNGRKKYVPGQVPGKGNRNG